MTKTKYTVFSDGHDAYVTSANPTRPQTLDGLIAYIVTDCPPTAWAPEATDMWGGLKSERELYAESIAAGRVIEMVDGRYVARGFDNGGGSSCATTQPLGVSVTGDDKFYDRMAEALGLPTVASAAAWREVGRELAPCGVPRGVWDGIVVYGIEATYKPAKSSGAIRREKLTGHGEGLGITKPALNTTEMEKARPPLAWATKTERDAFPGFIVTSITTEQGTAAHPLQRIADSSDPIHGSAFLR